MGFFDITSIKYEPELSGPSFRTYGVEGTSYVIVRHLKYCDAPIRSTWATRRDVYNYVNTSGHRGANTRHMPQVPFQAIFDELPNHIQEELIYEFDVFLEK